MKILEFKNVSYIYHSKQSEILAIKDLSFDVDKGEFISIVGPSGCGKTTILSLISNLIEKTKGEILFNGKKDNTINIGYMLQRDCLFEWRTIFQNACLGLEIKRDITPTTTAYVNDLLKKYGLYEFKDKYPNELSGGMRQRSALIRTLATSPDLLLLDEPTSSLDYQTRLNVSDDIYNIIQKENKTAILVTHDISEAISMSNRVIVLTKRPATVLNIHKIEIGDMQPLKRRESTLFPKYFEKIWGELN
ncbi:MAG: ABC transporter ATP-binding protein [Clostridia bacterium]